VVTKTKGIEELDTGTNSVMYNRLNQIKEENHRLRSTWILRGNRNTKKGNRATSVPCPKVEFRNRKGPRENQQCY